MAVDIPGEVATTALDLTKFIIEKCSSWGFMNVEIDGREAVVVVAFDGASRRLTDLMTLALDADAGMEGSRE